MKYRSFASAALSAIIAGLGIAVVDAQTSPGNVAEEIAWVVGDQAIWKSEIEEYYRQMIYDKEDIPGDPYCVVPEKLAIDKLYLHQAELDTVEVQPSMVNQQVESRINYFITNLGSKEKVEEYFHRTLPEMRESMRELIGNQYRIQQVQASLTKNVKVTPAEVTRFFNSLPADSVPFIPMQVEVQILTVNPVIPRQEIEDVKSRLRDYAERVNSGQSEFSTLAILYSEDPGTARRGGETGFMGRAHMDPEYAAVAFNLSDPKRVSKIVKSQYGYHIIQLIEKRGDRVNTRHILLRPKASDAAIEDAIMRLDSTRTEMVDSNLFTFEEIVPLISQDKDTRNNNGLMVNDANGSTLFRMEQLPAEVARAVDKLQPGEVSKPFIMKDPKTTADVVAIVRLSRRIDAHRANLSDDYQILKHMAEEKRKEKILADWLENKIASTYVRIEPQWRNCEFTHKGWIR